MDSIADIIFSLLTLSVLEIVLGIDNLVFIAIVSSRLPVHQQKPARRFGLMLAWISRLVLLASAVWLSRLTTPLFTIMDLTVSIRDIFLALGGLFLIGKAVQEINIEIEGPPVFTSSKRVTFKGVIIQIALLDIVFSLDSVLTAIGLTTHFWIMATAMSLAIAVMLLSSEILTDFIEKHPTIKILALSFLILIGVVLIADGFHTYIPRGYIYFSVCYAILVEVLNHIRRKKRNESK